MLIKNIVVIFSALLININQIHSSSEKIEKTETKKYKYAISGNNRISTNVIESHLKSLDPHSINEERIKSVLLELNYFKSVTAEYKNNIWNVTVKELPILKSVKYNVINGTALNGNWEAITGLKKRDFISNQTIKSTKEILKTTYQMFEETSDVTVSSYYNEKDGHIDLKFEINIQSFTPVHKAIFIGNKNLTHSELYDQLAKKNKKIFKIFNSKSISTSSLQQSSSQLVQYANNLGYLDFSIKSMSVEKIDNNQKLVVNINEGDKYLIKSVTIDSPINLNISYGKNMDFSLDKINTFKHKIEKELYDRNYFNYKVDYKTEKTGKYINFKFRVYETKPIRVNDINIYGNNRTHKAAILKRMSLEPGDIISAKGIALSKRNILHSGFCENLNINQSETSKTGLKDLNIDFKEVKTGVILFNVKAAFQKSMEYEFTIGYSDINFLGLGKSLKSDFSISKDSKNIGFELEEKFINGKPLHWFAGIDLFFLPESADSTFQDNVFNFGTRSDNASGSYSIIAKRLKNSTVLEKSINASEDILLSQKSPSIIEKDDKTEYWSENNQVIRTKTKGFDLRSGMSFYNKNHGFALALGTNIKRIEIKDNSTYIKDSKDRYKTGFGITRFFDKDIKKFDKWKNQLSLKSKYVFNIGNDDQSLKVNIGSNLNIGSSNFIQNNASLSFNKNFTPQYDLSINLSVTHNIPIYNYSWFDNIKSSNVRGFEHHGPRDTLRLNILGGKKSINSSITFQGPVMLPKTFNAKWFAFIDAGSLWDCGIKSKQVPKSLCDMRNWNHDTSDIAQDKFKAVVSCGLGIKVKLGPFGFICSMNCPLYGQNSPINSFNTLHFGFAQ